MTVVTFDSEEVQVLKTLAKSLIAEDSWLKKVWTWVMKTKLALVLYADMVAHLHAIFFLEENLVEGPLTLFSFFFSNLFTYPLIQISVAESMIWNAFFMVIGLYDLKRYCDRAWNDRRLRQVVKPYMTGEELLSVNTLQSIYCLKANQVLDDSVNFRREIMGTLPLLVMKIYFAYMDATSCSAVSIIRIFVILFGVYEPTKACLAQETSIMEFVKTGILFDMGLDFQHHDFNPNMPTRVTRLFDFLAITTSMVYRVYACVFYFLISPFVGVLQILCAILITVTLHLGMHPVYENPPIAVATTSYDIVEVIAKLFLVRTSRLYKSFGRVQVGLLFSWTLAMCLDHFASLYFIHLVMGGVAGVGGANETVPCPGWVSEPFRWFFLGMNPDRYLMGDSLLGHILINSPVFTTLFLLNLAVNGGHLVYLGCKSLNDPQFPVVSACHVWSERFFVRLQELKGQDQLEWAKKMMVLTLLSPEEFKKYIPSAGTCYAWESCIDWRRLVYKTEGAILPPDISEIPFRLRQHQSMSAGLIEFLNNVYSIPAGTDTETMKKLSYLVCIRFDSHMAKMDSRRLFLTCQLLGVSPMVKSPFAK